MKNTKSGDGIFLGGMVISMTCWGLSWSAGKVITNYGDPLTISFLRFAVTFLSLMVIMIILKESFSIRRQGYVELLTTALLISIYTYLFFRGLAEGKAGFGGVLVTVLNPIISYVIMLASETRKPTLNEAIGLTLGMLAGVILLQITTDPQEALSAGNVYFLLAAVTWAVLSWFTARATRYGSSVAFSFWIYAISTLIMLVVTGFSAPLQVLSHADEVFWGNMIFSSTITTSLATTFYFYATAKIGASRASSFIFMVPFSAALGSWIFLGEIIEMHTIVGGLLGIAAVYILNLRKNLWTRE
jgi:drug/metabolite transporter (DMT)-like permease